MADKTLNGRIQTKIDTASNWQSSTKPLLKGELAIDSTNHELRYGDGKNTFQNSQIVGMTVDSSLDANSSNPVQNKVISAALDTKIERVTFPYLEYAAYTTFASVPISSGNKSLRLLAQGFGNVSAAYTGAWIVELKADNSNANVTVTTLYPSRAFETDVNNPNYPVTFGYYKTSDTIYFGVRTQVYRPTNCGIVVLGGSTSFTIKNFGDSRSAPSGWTSVTAKALSRCTATKVVGTTKSGHTLADCDYLCDGTADQAEIQSAIDALPASGGKVILLEGTYNISQVIHLNKSNVTIKGMGQATVLKRSFKNNPLWWIGNEQSNICFRDFRIEGDYLEISNLGIYGIALNNIIIEKIHIYNEFAGIHLKNSNNITVRDCYITCSEQESATDYGIVIATPGGGYNQPNQYWKVYGNTVSNYKTGIGVLQAEHCLIENNIITDCGIGCKVEGTNNQVHGNYIMRGTGKDTDYNSTQDTIRVSGTYNDISDNYISGKNYINSGGTTNTFNNNRYQ